MYDYPAAHSMDTLWFAMDACGHVGVFVSGEEGAVVRGAPSADHLTEDFRPGELAWALEHSAVLRLGRHDTSVREYSSSDSRKRYREARGTFILSRRASSSRNAEFAPPRGGFADGRYWIRGSVPPAEWERLHRGPNVTCLACSALDLMSWAGRSALLGAYFFECTEYGTPPYVRGPEPASPVTVDTLRKLMPVPPAPAFPFCFSKKPKIQPLEWLPSARWHGSGWIREDGTVVPPPPEEAGPGAQPLNP